MKRGPKKLFYKIGEVCDIFKVEAHVLRYWESEFSMLSPTKNRAGQRIYRAKDLEIIETIRELLHTEGYTIAGARKKLRELGGGKGLPLFDDATGSQRRIAVSGLRKDIEALLSLLSPDEPTS